MERDWRYFTTYSGVKLPLKLVGPLAADELSHRNTFVRAALDQAQRVVLIEKMVYGGVQLAHKYQYDDDGKLVRAEITMDDDVTVLTF
ncbi:conserved hypothetical protein [Magnetospirillum sp. LM-5]|uniref:DUF6156 family protein n=1 Tax=Magnetospirillum sp. LM-5 TaxID=2681466 RepID=UPI001381199C|nr:DUF6156 family protein [Magnetospirillum sp. LM-5]CAA7614767.1 conserved hypothetical protein [Magnetospirillum sp. LM-5]